NYCLQRRPRHREGHGRTRPGTLRLFEDGRTVRKLLLSFWVFLWLTPLAAASDRLVFGLQAAYGLENDIPRNISHINMVYAQPQIGIVVWNSPESRLPIKRFDIVSEGILGGSTHPGGHLFGDTLMFR